MTTKDYIYLGLILLTALAHAATQAKPGVPWMNSARFCRIEPAIPEGGEEG